MTKKIIQVGQGWRIGDGSMVNLWEDNWHVGWDFFKPFSAPPNQTSLYLVSQLINPNRTWKIQLIRNNFVPLDVDKILATHISPIPLPNRNVWFVANNGSFSVKNGYWFVYKKGNNNGASSSHSGAAKTFWKLIWSNKLPPRLSFWAWQSFRGLLSIMVQLYNGE